MYKLVNIKAESGAFAGQILNTVVINLNNNDCIPFDPANQDYAKYLEWLGKGNQPLSADE